MTRSSYPGLILLCITFLAFLTTSVPAQQADAPSTLYQVAPFALFETGDYSGVITVNEMKNLGTLGIGGPENLDGELIQLDGKVWQITTDGIVSEPSGDSEVCLANIIRFEPSISYSVNKSQTYEDIRSVINDSFPDHDSLYAYRIDGEFSRMKVRSVPPQDEPYPPLSEVIANQTVFNLSDVNGTICGFWAPEWMKGVSFPGFHPHFITNDHEAGGHVLDFIAENVTISIQPVHRLTMILEDETK